MNDTSVFSPRLLIGWIAAAVMTFVLSLVFMLHGDDTTTVGPSTFSRSAIGHAGIAAVLQRQGLTVIKSQGASLHKLGAGGVLVLAEPELTLPLNREQQALLAAPTVLLVLPKWQGQPDNHHSGWIEQANLLPIFVPESVLSITADGSEVVRLDRDITWTRNALGQTPHLTAPFQLVKSSSLRPIVGSDEGMLVGEFRKDNRRIWVLADPDVISNHGLGDGNAAFAVALFDAMRHGQTIVFDETIHGFSAVPSNPMALLLRKPFSYVGIQAIIALGLLLWAGTARFGAPETSPPPLKAGKRDLVRNVAELFRFAGYQPVLIRRYVEETIRDTAHRLHAPRTLTDATSVHWLQRIGTARGVSSDCIELSARATALATGGRARSAELFRLPSEIWRWKQEMMHGVGGSAGDRGGHPRRSPQGRGGPG
jgi:hypothetical protein